MEKVRILLVDDHDIVRMGLRPVIESEWGWEVCGEGRDGLEAVALAGQLKPDVVILDVSMPKLNGVDATREIKLARPETEVLAFTGTESETMIHQLFVAGARACVLKSEASLHLIPAIKALCEHKPYLGSRVSQVVFESYLRGGLTADAGSPDRLTSREREIVRLLAEGRSNKEVGDALGIAVKTIETHRAAVMRKLGFNAFSELVRYAVRNHLVAP